MTTTTPNTRTYQASCFFATHGISTIPVKSDGSKKPLLDHWNPYRERIASCEERAKWFDGPNFLAVVCGAISGNLLIIDFDRIGLYNIYLTTADDHGLGDLARRLVHIRSPRGADHLYLRYESGEFRNDDQARGVAEGNKAIIQTRAEGGYAVAPPSSGYRLLEGKFDAIPVLTQEETEALLSLACLFDEVPRQRCDEDVKREKTDRDTNRPGDDYSARGDVLGVLHAHGWKNLYRHGETMMLQRPGKDGRGASATFNHGGHGYFYVFSTSAYPFEAERGYSPFAVYAILEHGGDFTAATAELGRRGFGAPAAAPKVKRPRATGAAAPTAEDEPPDEIEQSDYGLACAWARDVQDRFVYVEGDQWFGYQDGVWSYVSHEHIEAAVQHWLATLRAVPKAKVKLTATLVANVKRLAKSELGPIPLEKFNTRKDWLPLRNGVYDLTSGCLLPHSPINLLTHQSPFEFDDTSVCPLLLRCLSEWLIKVDGTPCLEWIDLLQEWFGYCLIADNRQQISMFWLGEGANGKGTVTRLLEQLVGEESCTSINIEMLHDPYHMAAIYGKLVGFVNEPDRRAMTKNGSFFKALTGGDDLIKARNPTEKVFTFKSVCRMIVTCNELPSTNDPSRAYYRRICVIDWRYNVPEEKRDGDLNDKLRLELPGVFNWALTGLRRLRERRKFLIPEESRMLLEEYRLSEDHMGRFMAEELTFAIDIKCADGLPAQVSINAADVFTLYKTWSDGNGLKPQTATALGRRLGKMGCTRDRLFQDGKLVRVWIGVRQRSEGNDDYIQTSPPLTDAPSEEELNG